MAVKNTGASSVDLPSSSGSRYALIMVPCRPFAIRSVLTSSRSYFSWIGYDLPQPERKHLAFSCDFGNGVEAGTGTGAGAGGEGVLGAIVLCIFRGCSIGGVLLLVVQVVLLSGWTLVESSSSSLRLLPSTPPEESGQL